jgi:hypothetical protein
MNWRTFTKCNVFLQLVQIKVLKNYRAIKLGRDMKIRSNPVRGGFVQF